MKRVLLLLLAGVLSVGLAACGGGFAGYDPGNDRPGAAGFRRI